MAAMVKTNDHLLIYISKPLSNKKKKKQRRQRRRRKENAKQITTNSSNFIGIKSQHFMKLLLLFVSWRLFMWKKSELDETKRIESS